MDDNTSDYRARFKNFVTKVVNNVLHPGMIRVVDDNGKVRWRYPNTKPTTPPVQPPPPPVVVPPPDNNGLNYGIIIPVFEDNGLTLAGKWTPFTQPIQDIPNANGKKGRQIPVMPSAWDYIAKTNTPAGLKYAQSVHMLWINKDYNAGETPMAESVTCPLNVVAWRNIVNGCAELECFDNTDDFSKYDPNVMNWYNFPYKFFQTLAVSQNADGSLKFAKVTSGIDCVIPLMNRSNMNGTGKLYLGMSFIAPFPTLPVDVKMNTNVNVHGTPDVNGAYIKSYASGEVATVVEYRPLGASVWGRTKDGWIVLRYSPSPNVILYLTDWTLPYPPIPAKVY